MTVVAFPREHRPHVEVVEVRDRVTGRRMWIFDLVGRDKSGPFRVDVAHRFTMEDVAADLEFWRRDGMEVRFA